jgi:hypothetical protein
VEKCAKIYIEEYIPLLKKTLKLRSIMSGSAKVGDDIYVLERIDYRILTKLKTKIWKLINQWEAESVVLKSGYINNKNHFYVHNTGSMNINPLILTIMVESAPSSRLLVSPVVNYRNVQISNLTKINNETKTSLADAMYDEDKSDYFGVRQLVIFPYKVAPSELRGKKVQVKCIQL